MIRAQGTNAHVGDRAILFNTENALDIAMFEPLTLITILYPLSKDLPYM
jgi:hypothetical protein